MTPLSEIAGEFLTAVRNHAVTSGIVLPDRQYITPGVSTGEAWDSDQVVVGLVSVNPGQASTLTSQLGGPSRIAPGGVSLWSATFRLEIVRCVPWGSEDGEPPTADELTAAGAQTLADASLLQAVAVDQQATNRFSDGERADLALGAVVPVGPQGGYAAVGMPITVTLL